MLPQRGNQQQGNAESAKKTNNLAPSISLPKGGGAIRGIDEKFSVNPVTGTGSLSVPIFTSPGRSDFSPDLSLDYDSGAGNGPFGLGWNLSIPSITRKTDKGLPKYQDAEESDTFILSGAEDLVPSLVQDENGNWVNDVPPENSGNTVEYNITRYRPRIEGLFARIEKWENKTTGEVFWKSISKDNITSFYGKSPNSRIADPENPTRVFKWLLEESYDDKGNVILYEYKQENENNIDPSLPQEKNRIGKDYANCYLKRIKYGNKKPRSEIPDPESDYLFEVVFDYGDHNKENPAPDDDKTQTWKPRQDAFSSYRAGFEIRTQRLCQRVLMFHHFEELGTTPCLVRSTDFSYQESPIMSYLVTATQTGYVKKENAPGYDSKALPPLEFSYTEAKVDETIRCIDAESLENLPIGLDGAQYQWVDLDGEGISGILTEQAGAWFYKRNLGNTRFAPTRVVASKPSAGSLQSAQTQIMDLAGDGQKDLVLLDEPLSGFYERTQDGRWDSFVAFTSFPNVRWNDPNLRFVDLNGDGHADVLVTEDEVFTWYPSKAEDGFGASERVRKEYDEEKGPTLVFADATQSVYLADMSGDGLSDIVRIRNGNVCYWPNLGYGRFGAKVTMDTPPYFDSPDLFDQKRIRLADIDGSGTSDIIYLGGNIVSFWYNQSGNSWSPPYCLTNFPNTDNLASVTIADLLGNGTACLVWSSSLPGEFHQPMRYIDLMGGVKPHLLQSTKDNMGAETRLVYASSTKFYLKDLEVGTPWTTRLPFPVHVLERVETYDHISRNRFVSRYAYHHGYFDGIEREFRGFGLVEQWDTEEFAALSESDTFPTGDNIDQASHIPPVLTKTWFHTGAYLQGKKISKQFEDEYYRESDQSEGLEGLTDEQLQAMLLDDTVLPDSIKLPDGTHVSWELSAEEIRQACRALKGSVLRQEVYGLDGTNEEDRPYSVSESNYTIELLQPHSTNKHAVFFAHPRETINFHYERKLFKVVGTSIVDPQTAPSNAKDVADPRVTHTITLAVDTYGNVLRSVAIGYGRRYDDPDPLLTSEDRDKQKRTLITYTENTYTNLIDEEDAYRTPLPCETRTFELLKVEQAPGPGDITNLYQFSKLQQLVETQDFSQGNWDIPYHDVQHAQATDAHPYRRLIEQVRTLYRCNDLAGPLPLGQVQSLALPFESYKLAFTPGLLANVYQRRPENQPPENLLPDRVSVLHNEGGYVDLDGNGCWWIPSGQIFYSPDITHNIDQELAFAQQHFFLPHRFRDPFEQTTTVTYDSYDLLIQETCDPLGNLVTTGERDPSGLSVAQGNDYRVLQPVLITDPNGNRSEVAFDTLGLVVGTAVMGKIGENEGDLLTNDFKTDLEQNEIETFFTNPKGAIAKTLLDKATTRIIYDVDCYFRTGDPNQPPYAATLARETHVSDPLPAGGLKIQVSFSYSDGFGREIQKKIQAEPGQLDPDDPNSPHTDPRWVGSGWTIFNNKGKPVKQYEPFFDDTHDFRFGKQVGVSPILFYDPLERVVATLHPNHTYEKVIFDPWRQETWDVNDTVLQTDPRNDPDVGDFFRRLPDADYLPTWYESRISGTMGTAEHSAATKAAVHANTPTIAYFDTLGRPFLSLAHNKFERNGATIEETYATRTELDIEGNTRAVTDARENTVMEYAYNIIGPEEEEEEDEEKPDSHLIYQKSMDAGDRWMLYNVADNPIRTWDSRNHEFIYSYDELQRPILSHVKGGDGDTPLDNVFEKIIYGDWKNMTAAQRVQSQKNNLIGQPKEHYDTAGKIEFEDYDFKGNLKKSTRRLAKDYKNVVDWGGANLDTLLESESFTSESEYDALNRVTLSKTPDDSITVPGYNEANLLESVDVTQNRITKPYVKNIDYDAKGQRTGITYGNDVFTIYEYDKETFRLTHLQTKKANNHLLQDLTYTYDPTGNITEIRDDAQQTIYFNNQVVSPNAKYEYDALYRLIKAQGREHIGQSGNDPQINRPDLKPHYDFNDSTRKNLPHPNDGQAMRRYTQLYEYDSVGNILAMIHQANNGNWTRRYQYATGSNRLMSTSLPGDPAALPYSDNTQYSATYEYDEHGNMTRMPHLQKMQWDFEDQLQASSKQVVNNDITPETTYYVYDTDGQRVRKITERQNGSRKNERIYLQDFEIYREYQANGIDKKLERETLHIMDDERCIALVETKTHDEGAPVSAPTPLVRYQLDNHLGSASLELDENGEIISYEEYYPYGSTSYQAMRSGVEVSLKRYRYTGKERDEETGLYYYGARHYVSWLGRWTCPDPIKEYKNKTPYAYANNNPIFFIDPNGKQDGSAISIKREKREPYDLYAEYRPEPKGDWDDIIKTIKKIESDEEKMFSKMFSKKKIEEGVKRIKQIHLEEHRRKLEKWRNWIKNNPRAFRKMRIAKKRKKAIRQYWHYRYKRALRARDYREFSASMQPSTPAPEVEIPTRFHRSNWRTNPTFTPPQQFVVEPYEVRYKKQMRGAMITGTSLIRIPGVGTALMETYDWATTGIDPIEKRVKRFENWTEKSKEEKYEAIAETAMEVYSNLPKSLPGVSYVYSICTNQ